MIDFTEIYESQMPDPVGARSVTERTAAAALTKDGGYVHREAYSFNTPHHAVDFLNRPIDVNSPLKFVRKQAFDLAAEGEPLFERAPRKRSFGNLDLGKGISLAVDYSEPIRLYASGLASVKFVATDEYYEAIARYEDALKSLPDAERQKKDAQSAAWAEYERTHPFDAEKVFSGKYDNKTTNKNREQAINKKRSQWQKNAHSAARAAAEKAMSERNASLTASGLSDVAIRLIMNGSFEYVDTTLYWYPTTLDLARMFDLTINVPTKYFLAVDANDDRPPAEEAGFRREVLAESFESVTNGELAFDDVRDAWHSTPSGTKQLPLAKPVRWKNMVRRFRAEKVPLLSFSRFDKSRTFGLNGETWDGKTGRVLAKFVTKTPGMRPSYNIVTVDGLLIAYPQPDAPTPTTAFFMTPSTLADKLRFADPMPKTVSVNMIRRTFQNLVDLTDEADEMFGQKGGTRRYLP